MRGVVRRTKEVVSMTIKCIYSRYGTYLPKPKWHFSVGKYLHKIAHFDMCLDNLKQSALKCQFPFKAPPTTHILTQCRAD